MHITINQSIYIHFLKVGSINNSSVLQIGSTGKMQALSQLYNTGGYETTAEEATPQEIPEPMVPLSPF
ncbi:spore germination protein GerPB [Gracilibacillus kekensis]|uniref:Spore germination protein PB n=1 Tax=Gracilibacillus kekensis TaxID=1027249 RepID=A0A1M7ISL1_9BACI|nr:spore germination protein GerPB [Gracilibacillus kekensis]SHM43679.1 spore germination protein PB [Gracilibacillus kekensis]